jgi:hypothetical protein
MVAWNRHRGKPAIAAAAALLLLLAAGLLSCEKTSKVLWVRVDCSDMTIACVDDFELVFRPTGGTLFRKPSNGAWADGDIHYVTEEREGILVFVVYASGNWIREQVQNNTEKFPGQFVFELPLKNIESSGSFDLRGNWRYRGVITGTARHPTGQNLTIPDADSIFSIAVYRETNDLCVSGIPDAETAPEVVEEVEIAPDWVEDLEPAETEEILDAESDLQDTDGADPEDGTDAEE